MRQHEEGLRRDFRITAEILETIGYTTDCAGCEAKILGTDHRNHSAECRKRLEKEMQRDENMKEALERRNMRMQMEPPPEAADIGGLPKQHDQNDDVQMEDPDEEMVNPGAPVFLDEDGRPASTSSGAAASGSISSQESLREVEVPDSPRQTQNQ